MTTITKEQKTIYSEKHFKGCKPKELKEITYKTPEGHNVKALICRKPNRYLGSLLILEVDDEPTEQFIQGMPKIHYLDNYHMLRSGSIYDHYDVYEKLDGTNICLYGLKNNEGKLIEIVPKSRNMGTLDKEFHSRYMQCDTYRYEKLIQEHPNFICYLELYGIGNLHMIKHMETYLDVKFLGLYNGERFMKDTDLLIIPHLRRPKRLFRVYNIKGEYNGGNTFYVNSEGLNNFYGEYIHINGMKCRNMDECIGYMKDSMEKLNRKYDEHNGRLALEGAVINGINMNGEFTFIKVKPDTIEMAHKSENGIPRQYIMKEIMKYLDEHESTAKATWEQNPEEVMDYINRNLSESFEQIYITKSQSKIRRLFEDRITPQPVSEEIIKIGDQLIEEYPEKTVTDLMRIFGQNYPELKKSGGRLYKYLEDKKR